MDNNKFVDESWKDSVSREKDVSGGCSSDACGDECSCGQEEGEFKVNFLTYLTSMGYQAMIFLGEVPHPSTNQFEKNLPQAKFLIDTLLMIRDKTKGNLTEQEDSFLSGTLFELQTKYVEVTNKSTA